MNGTLTQRRAVYSASEADRMGMADGPCLLAKSNNRWVRPGKLLIVGENRQASWPTWANAEEFTDEASRLTL